MTNSYRPNQHDAHDILNRFSLNPKHIKQAEHSALVRYVTEQADENFMQQGCMPLLHTACLINDTELIDACLYHKGLATYQCEGELPLHRLVRSYDPTKPERFSALVSNGADINALNRVGETPLVCALRDGSPVDNSALPKLLLTLGASPNKAGPCGITPLMHATGKNNIAIIHELMGRGANILAEDEIKQSVMHYVTSADMVACLIAYGANVNHVNEHNECALAEKLNPDNTSDDRCAEALIKHGSALHGVDWDSNHTVAMFRNVWQRVEPHLHKGYKIERLTDLLFVDHMSQWAAEQLSLCGSGT